MDQRSGAQISSKAFTQSLLILLGLMIVAGILTLIVPAGRYAREPVDGREVIDPASFQFMPRPDYPAWRWFTAPVEVLWGSDGLIIIVIIIFLLMVGSAFAAMDKSGILRATVARVVQALGGRKYLLLCIISLLFMLVGAFFGIFEEVVPLVPLMIALSYSLGWDSLTGLGMSILATNMGFSAAVMNPFTIGVAQEIAELPLFSGAWFRIPVFCGVYIVLVVFLVQHARKVERAPESSPVHEQDRIERQKYGMQQTDALKEDNPRLGRAIGLFLIFFVLILAVLLSGAFVSAISDIALPLVGLLLLTGGVAASLVAGVGGRTVLKAVWEGILGIAPAIPLILMAASIKHIIAEGAILDTILHSASEPFSQASPFLAALAVYGLALLIEFFVASGSAKAFLLMPILLPLADLVGVTRQVTVLAYTFGDGFSNLAYPTNPVLLICLGLAAVSYIKWLKWSFRLWVWVLLVTVAFLGLAVAISLGPF
jgi:uncharacterized ion transporter superfamily protein YfcC